MASIRKRNGRFTVEIRKVRTTNIQNLWQKIWCTTLYKRGRAYKFIGFLNNAFLLSVSYNEKKVIQDYNKLEKSKIFINNCKIIKTPIYINEILTAGTGAGKENLTLHKIMC